VSSSWLLDTIAHEARRAVEAEARRHTRRVVESAIASVTGMPIPAPTTDRTAMATLPGDGPDGLSIVAREDAVRAYLAQDTIQVAILGAPGTGKTALMLRMADLRHRPTFVLGIPQRALDDAGVGTGAGGWMRAIAPGQLGSVPRDSDVLIDDASQVIGNEEYGTELFEQFRALTENRRHFGIGLILNCQTGKAVNAYALTCELLALKPGCAFFPEQERDGMAPFLREADALYQGMSAEQVHHTVMIYRKWPSLRGPIRYRFPEWFTRRLSAHKAARRLPAIIADSDSVAQGDEDADSPIGAG